MADNNTAFYQQILDITSADDTQVSYQWSIQFKIKDTFTGDLALTDDDKSFIDPQETSDKLYTPMQVTNLDFNDNYEKGIMREIWTRAVFPFGMWVKCLYPARENITAIVKRKPLMNKTFAINTDGDEEEFIYDALFHVDESNSFPATDLNKRSRFDLDNAYPPVSIDIELLERAVEQLRKVTVGGIFRNVAPEDYIKNTLANFTKDLTVDGEKAINTISMVEANNTDKRNHIVIPHGMPLLDVPNYVQNNCGGVYNADLNCFALEDKIYVYPIYQTDRFEKEKKNLTVIRVEKQSMSQVEVSYKIDGDSLHILATSDASFKDISLAKKLNTGNGVRFTDSRKFLNGFVTTKDNKAFASRKDVNSEYLSEDLKEQNTVYVSETRISSNPYKERSKLAVRDGGVYSFQWANSKPELIYPGMPARILYEENDEVKELRGLVLSLKTSVALIGSGVTAAKHGTVSALSLFALPYEETPA